MTKDDELRAVADALAEGERTMRTPRVVVEAFLPPPASACGIPLGPLTMEGWLRLIEAESAFIGGEKPRAMDARMRQLVFAVSVLSGPPMDVTELMLLDTLPEEVLASWDTVAARIDEAFATQLPMERPRRKDDPPPESRRSRDGGMGWWAITFVALLQDLGMSRAEAMKTPVAEAGVLQAGAKFRQGWEVKGSTWREEEILGEEAS